jgi:hypothetical protein
MRSIELQHKKFILIIPYKTFSTAFHEKFNKDLFFLSNKNEMENNEKEKCFLNVGIKRRKIC